MILHSLPQALTVVLSLRHESEAFLGAAVTALQAQTLPKRHWRLIVVDDRLGEGESLETSFAWHPHVTLVRMTKAGPVTPEFRALMCCRTELSVLVRGHTAIDPHYLERAVEIARAHPLVGIFGGSVEGRGKGFNPSWQSSFLDAFGVRSHPETRLVYDADPSSLPSSNAFVVRRIHLQGLREVLERHPFFKEKKLIEHRRDFDFRSALTRSVVQAGSSVGNFPQLRATRFFERADLQEKAVAERLRNLAFSRIVERFVWTGMLPPEAPSSPFQRFLQAWMRFWEIGRTPRLHRAHREGQQAGLRLALQHTVRVAKAPMRGSRLSPSVPTAVAS